MKLTPRQISKIISDSNNQLDLLRYQEKNILRQLRLLRKQKQFLNKKIRVYEKKYESTCLASLVDDYIHFSVDDLPF